MSNNIPTKRHLREVMLFFYNQKKNATECHRLLSKTYPGVGVSKRMCQQWFFRFKSGDFDVKDKDRPGQIRRFEDEELKTLLDEDPSQTLKQLAQKLNVDKSTVSKRLKAKGMVRTQSNWAQYKTRKRDTQKQFYNHSPTQEFKKHTPVNTMDNDCSVIRKTHIPQDQFGSHLSSIAENPIQEGVPSRSKRKKSLKKT